MTEHKPATVVDVAREARVSVATVSRVLNGHAGVDPELAERVRIAAQGMRYVPNMTGRALRRRVADVFTAIVSDMQNPYFTTLVAAFERVAVANNFSVMLCNTDENLERERQYFQTAVAQQMAGALVAVTSNVHSDLSPLRVAGIAIVLVDRRTKDHVGDSVMVDNLRVGEMAAEHLIDNGFRRIACIAGPADVSTTEDRVSAFRKALSRRGLKLGRPLLSRANLRVEGGEAAMAHLLALEERPDAVFATNGPLTEGCFRAIKAAGAFGQTALLGVDDDRWTGLVDPDVSVLAQPVAEIGTTAAELLLARAVNPKAPSTHVVLEPTFVARASSRPHG